MITGRIVEQVGSDYLAETSRGKVLLPATYRHWLGRWGSSQHYTFLRGVGQRRTNIKIGEEVLIAVLEPKEGDMPEASMWAQMKDVTAVPDEDFFQDPRNTPPHKEPLDNLMELGAYVISGVFSDGLVRFPGGKMTSLPKTARSKSYGGGTWPKEEATQTSPQTGDRILALVVGGGYIRVARWVHPASQEDIDKAQDASPPCPINARKVKAIHSNGQIIRGALDDFTVQNGVVSVAIREVIGKATSNTATQLEYPFKRIKRGWWRTTIHMDNGKEVTFFFS